MEDIIPLLIIIAISVIAAIGRKKDKRKKPNISAPQNSQDNDGIFDWLEKITDDEHEEVEETVQYASQPSQAVNEKQYVAESTSQTEQTWSKPNKYSAYSGFISPEEKKKLLENEGKNTVKQRESTIYKHVEQHRDSINKPLKLKRKSRVRAFNLKKAVIYSEILNKKYN
jgi:hypothetical protein